MFVKLIYFRFSVLCSSLRTMQCRLHFKEKFKVLALNIQLQSVTKIMKLAPPPLIFNVHCRFPLLVPGQHCLSYFFQALHNTESEEGAILGTFEKSNYFLGLFQKNIASLSCLMIVCRYIQ